MKKSCTLLVLCLFFIQSNGQVQEIEEKNIEIGVNATALITNIFSSTSFDDYLLTLKKKLKSGKTLRVGLGLDGSFLTDDPSSDDINNGTTITSFEFDLRG